MLDNPKPWLYGNAAIVEFNVQEHQTKIWIPRDRKKEKMKATGNHHATGEPCTSSPELPELIIFPSFSLRFFHCLLGILFRFEEARDVDDTAKSMSLSS